MTFITLYYIDDSLQVKKAKGHTLHNDDITTEFDIELYDNNEHSIYSELIHVLYSHSQNKVFELNPKFNEDDPSSRQYIPFRFKAVGLKTEQRFQISDYIACKFD